MRVGKQSHSVSCQACLIKKKPARSLLLERFRRDVAGPLGKPGGLVEHVPQRAQERATCTYVCAQETRQSAQGRAQGALNGHSLIGTTISINAQCLLRAAFRPQAIFSQSCWPCTLGHTPVFLPRSHEMRVSCTGGALVQASSDGNTHLTST